MGTVVGKLRIKSKGSSGGHNGLKNIEEILGSQNYPRLRFGINNKEKNKNKVDFVLNIVGGGPEYKNISNLIEKLNLKENVNLVGPKHGHNEIWKQKALEIGCDAKRCHYVVFSKPTSLIIAPPP